MAWNINIQQLGHLSSLINEVGRRLYQTPPNTIANVGQQNWPTAEQPIRPMAPEGSTPLAIPFMWGQNMSFTPRFDSELTAAELRGLSTFPLARICIENVKDQICQLPWQIQLRPMPGETRKDVAARRKVMEKGDKNIVNISNFLEFPDLENDWPTWLRYILDDMLVVDAASVWIRKRRDGALHSLRWVPGDNIARFIDDNGITPAPPSPAYAQLWEGIPRVHMTVDQLLYRPRNIVPRNTYSSLLYGYSPVEQVAPEIQIGMARLDFVWAYYKTGSIPNAIQIVPAKVPVDQIRDAQNWMNSQLSGNLEARRTWRMVQGFAEEGNRDQILFPKEPVLADVFDDLMIRKICFAIGTSPQRLQRMINRASAQSSQQSAEDEGIRPWMGWVCKAIINPLLYRMAGSNLYEMTLKLEHDADQTKQNKIDANNVDHGMRTINEIRIDNGDDPSADPAADELAITTPTGRVPIGIPNSGTLVQRGEKKALSSNKANGVLHVN